MGSPHPTSRFEGKLYLQCLETLVDAFPALESFLHKLAYEDDAGRQAVRQHYEKEHQRTPGRCYCLEFKANIVNLVEEVIFGTADALRAYFEKFPAKKSREERHRRLFILEDMEPDYVDALGHHLGVDPLVFSEQMNTMDFTDSWSIPHRGLPSMSIPGQSFTLRYYELRTLLHAESVSNLKLHASFAVNRRRYERWREIDIPSLDKPDRRHAFVRRCASFWTSQFYGEASDVGWDAVILVDPAFATESGDMAASECLEPRETDLNSNVRRTLDDCLILEKSDTSFGWPQLWRAQNSYQLPKFEAVSHLSWPYHQGCSTLAPLMFSEVGLGTNQINIPIFQPRRNLTSAMDEMVFYWTKLATPKLIQETNEDSSNTGYYLLKHIAQHWVNQLELTNTTIGKAEYFMDVYQSRIHDHLSKQKWKNDLRSMNEAAIQINFMRRNLNAFSRAMSLNLERLGVPLGGENLDTDASRALQDAQKDFLPMYTSIQPLLDRVEALNSATNDQANLRAALRSVSDGEFSLRLSLFASIIFPLTLLAGIFSMSDDYLPGQPQFWKLWAIGIPVCVVVALVLSYGKRPWTIFTETWEYLEVNRLFKAGRKKAAHRRETEKHRPGGQPTLRRRAGWTVPDEENGVAE